MVPSASKNKTRPKGEQMIQDLITEYGVLTQTLADQQNQLQTAALQHGNDQQEISSLNTQLTGAQARLDDLQAKYDAQVAFYVKKTSDLEGEIERDAETIQQLQSTVTYPDLEWAQFALNLKPDAASGRGTSTFTPADTGKPALFSIVPDAPVPGDKDNYFNVFATRKLKPNTAYTNYTLRGKWEFPTDADMRAAHCIEMEARQVRKLLTPDPLPNQLPIELPLMSVPALQMNFSAGVLRYFNALAPGDNWIPTGIPMPRQRSVARSHGSAPRREGTFLRRLHDQRAATRRKFPSPALCEDVCE
jgi:hypothetical protein